jgi:hypothetical protein
MPFPYTGNDNRASIGAYFNTRLRDVNVKEYGAVGDGASHPLSQFYSSLSAAQAVFPHAVALTDEIDWAAMQAAINASRREVQIPEGKYRWNRGITGVNGLAIVGDGIGARSLSSTYGTIIDATAISSGTVLAVASANDNLLEDFYIEGMTGGTAIMVDGARTMRRVCVNRGRTGLRLQAIGSVMEDCWFDLQSYHGVEIYQLGKHRFRGCSFANVTNGGGSNFFVYGSAYDVRVEDCLFDECFGAGSWTAVIAAAVDFSMRGCKVYNGPGGGIHIGEGGLTCQRVTLDDVRVMPFSSNPGNTILIDAGNTGVRLIDVSTDPGAGGDISDLAADTVWYNVNGRVKLPALPSANPGAGSKQLWYDAADSNRVKFAP